MITITPTRRRSDYAFDDGRWIASAKNYAAGDAFDPPPGFPDDDDGTEDGGGPPRA